MEHSADAPLGLAAAPQHLRRRRLHGDIPDPLLVPGAEPLPLEPRRPSPNRAVPAKRAASTALKPAGNDTAAASGGTPSAARVPSGRKRAVALALVIFVSLSVPTLALALILAG